MTLTPINKKKEEKIVLIPVTHDTPMAGLDTDPAPVQQQGASNCSWHLQMDSLSTSPIACDFFSTNKH